MWRFDSPSLDRLSRGRILVAVTLGMMSCPAVPAAESARNSLGQEMITIPAGAFAMGQARDPQWREKALSGDEAPVHRVTISHAFKLSATEVTNAQFEVFRPQHRQQHATAFQTLGLGDRDDDPATYVTWEDAAAFCQWLSQKEGVSYRLPTEAEWEYACRAGTATEFSTGKTLAPALAKHQRDPRDNSEPVDTAVGKTPANPWGLYDMHGNVEEWVADWYGAYAAGEAADPVGPADGIYKVTRGGSHNTQPYFLRSANRAGMLPDDANWLVGFRVVQAPALGTQPTSAAAPEPYRRDVAQTAAQWQATTGAFLDEPIEYVRPPADADVPFYKHNHSPVLTWCPNGDLLAFWFSTRDELGRELDVLGSRLQRGSREWQPASLVAKAPDRNMHGFALFQEKGRIYFLQGINIGDRHDNTASALSTSDNNGADWTRPRMVYGNHLDNLQSACGAILVRKSGEMIVPFDGFGKPRNTRLIHSTDGGKSWSELTKVEKPLELTTEIKHALIAGWHAGVVEREDGSLLAVGREAPMAGGRMPLSISRDGGRTWSYQPSEFPMIGTSQRMVLMRLNEGAILLASFTDDIVAVKKGDAELAGMEVRDAAGQPRRIFGLFATVSFDGGRTWKGTKTLSPGGEPREMKSVRDTPFTLDATHGCPNGYLAATQTPDGVVHLVSSTHYYRTNLAWLRQPLPAATTDEQRREARELAQLELERQTHGSRPKKSGDDELNFNAKE